MVQRSEPHPTGEDCFLVTLKATVVTLGLAVLMGLWHDEVAALTPGPARSRVVVFDCSGWPGGAGGQAAAPLLRALGEAGFEAEAVAYNDAAAERLLTELAGPGVASRPAGFVRPAAAASGEQSTCGTVRFEELLRGLEAAGVAAFGHPDGAEALGQDHTRQRWEEAAPLVNGTEPGVERVRLRTLGAPGPTSAEPTALHGVGSRLSE
uniref:Uncharacterized protein n=1 Tax=Pyrodinium bahamense TaxID=73915 RepID=A0A7S0ATI7_9DINO|mmetsp:Transcript_41594/g.115760  ORF Transcript_41594/g.115760 Transcript_41594/m.115760 type:complete len:208 (+) Transcript_41594:91-714(+)